MSLRNWIDRSPGVKRLLEPSEDGREGVSVEPPAMPRHVYTLDYGAGETIRVDGASAVRWSPGTTLLGIALTHAEPGSLWYLRTGTGRTTRSASAHTHDSVPRTASGVALGAWKHLDLCLILPGRMASPLHRSPRLRSS